MRQRFIFTVLYFLLNSISCFSQEVDIHVHDVPLNQILIGLRDKYKLEFSFNDQLLSNYRLSINQIWDTPEDALRSILKELPLTYTKQGGVFLILPKGKQFSIQNFHLSGQVAEAKSNEPLPFSQLYINNRILVSDLNGNFTYLSAGDSIFHVKVSHLGYFILDTVVIAGSHHKFNLTPSTIGLREIVIKNKFLDRSTHIGSRAGMINVNHQIAKYLPGSGDNSVFTLLRLMPGILASSEQSNGLIIWGSYEGHSQVLLDGFTIWGLKSFNDDIDAVNPLIAKEIEVLKGGYDASYGGRVGGIVNIAGKTGNMKKPSFSLNINNVTVNGMAEVPLWKNSSVIMSFRQTYYNLYKGKDIFPADNENQIITPDKNKPKIDYTVLPDYFYRDANIRFTTRSQKGELFYLSLLTGQDRFRYSINPIYDINGLFNINAENNYQYGASALYGRHWKNGNITNFTTSWSMLETGLSKIQSIQPKNNFFVQIANDQTYNSIAEYSGHVDNFIKLSQSHMLETGLGFVQNVVGLKADSSGVNRTNQQTQVGRLGGYLQDHISLPGAIEFKFGLRAEFPFNLQKIYLQPRLSASVKISDYIKFNAAWGVYNQFISKSSVVDNQGNYRYIWTSCNNQQIPVLMAVHSVVGSTYHNGDFTFSIEAYSKSTDGLTRFINEDQKYSDLIYKGKGRSYGLDFFVKKDFNGHSAWVSYTLSKTEEKFSYFSTNEFQPAPQDQRHELKLAVLFNVKPFNFSANYVFGSGFPLNNGTIVHPVFINPDYNRIDVAVNFRFDIGKVAAETGLSLLNLFNSKNIRYSNFEKVPVDQSNTLNIYSQAVPFSPRLSLRLFY